jgi:hypothetical protein
MSVTAAVTLQLRQRGRQTVSCTFASPADFASFVSTRDIVLTSKDGVRRLLVRTLAEAQSGDEGDYLQMTAPSFGDQHDEAIAALERRRLPGSAEHERAVTSSISRCAALQSEYGELRVVADGGFVLFVDAEGGQVLHVDGLVAGLSVVLLHMAKPTPSLADVGCQVARKLQLQCILAHPSAYTSAPAWHVVEALAGITSVVPILSGATFEPAVEAQCREMGVRAFKIDGDGDDGSVVV